MAHATFTLTQLRKAAEDFIRQAQQPVAQSAAVTVEFAVQAFLDFLDQTKLTKEEAAFVLTLKALRDGRTTVLTLVPVLAKALQDGIPVSRLEALAREYGLPPSP